jgi:ribosome-associated protein
MDSERVKHILQACVYKTSRSSGPGGQNVNKLETKVEIRFHIQDSQVFTEEEKTLILQKLASKINSDGYLIVTAQEKRSQLQNKEIAKAKFIDMLSKALVKPKKRSATKPSKSSQQKRVKAKKLRSGIKVSRGRVDWD